MGRLVVMRHSKAEQDGPTDFERPLADRGLRDAADAGAWLANTGFVPDHALVSAALRTRETWASLAGGASWTLEPDFDRGLYAAGPETAIDLIRLVPDEVDSLLVIGHNPTMAYLAQLLDSGDGPSGAGDALEGDFPTSALAVFGYDGAWADLTTGSADLVASYVGRG
ncbi:SixA phosphatase family protein [Nocardioides mangrovi]|uniref:Histidine phosphatase family protein n=1 Tax=Nocardioides mangrovi TaxID=2874580 RepID=A0ABS7UGI9_9ACTN|nr:histidine phosphatase family protein [Nocardioides mangrovi]MBZ5739950.1 histidine phosphatase family protein [Nocardioides mangrovi]